LISAFALLLLLILGLLWVIIHLDGYWYVKAIFITLLLYLSLSIFLSIENFKGWATNQSLPEEFRIEWVIIQEPDKANRMPGAIYIWTSSVDSEPLCLPGLLCLSDEAKGPRAYVIQYSTESHEQSLELLELLRAGEEITGEINKDRNDDELMLDDITVHNITELPEELRKE
jgi:hypothetical protein